MPPSTTASKDAENPGSATLHATSKAVELVHAADVARTRDVLADLRQQPPAPPYLDALCALVKRPHDDDDGNDGNDDRTVSSSSSKRTQRNNAGGTRSPDYHAALSELDYLAGLFKKLRFSYREQLTKETVVRRILELELPLLGAADIDAMVQATEAARRRLRASKTEAASQGAAAEQLLRALVAERRYVAEAARATAALPDRLRLLRHQLARLTLALRAELAARSQLDGNSGNGGGGRGRPGPGASPDMDGPTFLSCRQCGRSFYAAAFLDAHMATQHAETAGAADTDDLVYGETMLLLHRSLPPPLPLRRCRGCDQHVPAALVDEGPEATSGEAHAAFHERLQRETVQARASLAVLGWGDGLDGRDGPGGPGGLDETGGVGPASDDLALLLLLLETDEETAPTAPMALSVLQKAVAEATERERSVRAAAERQAAAEADMAASLAHLRASVGSIQETTRRQAAEQRTRASLDQGRSSLGRVLQEQAGLYEVLLGAREGAREGQGGLSRV